MHVVTVDRLDDLSLSPSQLQAGGLAGSPCSEFEWPAHACGSLMVSHRRWDTEDPDTLEIFSAAS